MMEVEAAAPASPGRWGTWEELLLGGAVLRHGTHDWDLVASELRSRILLPYDFTPEICKAKYRDLRRRFPGCKAWFEELRKQRMQELRQALEQSDSSIGSLESKLENLKAEKEEEPEHIDYDSSRTVSMEPVQKHDRAESFERESQRDDGLLSPSSFTREASSDPYAEEVPETKLTASVLSLHGRDLRISHPGNWCLAPAAGCIRKRRGKRKRKDCGGREAAKEGSVGESHFANPISTVVESRESKETSTSNDNLDLGRVTRNNDDLMRIFNSVMEHKSARVFLHRVDDQKRGRYRKLIRNHLDLTTVKSKLMNHFAASSTELFRDLLLVANNALVFYSKKTSEYKSALLLRDAINRSMRSELNKEPIAIETVAAASEKTDPPAKTKPRSSQKPSGRRGTGRRNGKTGRADSVPSAALSSSSVGKRGVDAPRRGRGGAITGRGRKRARTTR